MTLGMRFYYPSLQILKVNCREEKQTLLFAVNFEHYYGMRIVKHPSMSSHFLMAMPRCQQERKKGNVYLFEK